MTEARAQFSDLINRVGFGRERIVLTRHGKPLVALVPADDVVLPHQDPADAAVVLDLSSTPSGPHRGDYSIAARDTGKQVT